MLVVLTFVIMAIVAYAFWREGLLTALAMPCNIFLAGLVAFDFFEPLANEASSLFEGFLPGYEDAFCLALLFSVTLALLRTLSNNLTPHNLTFHAGLQQVGSLLCALTAGYLLSGFLLCVVQTLPLNEHFLGFDAGSSQVTGLRRFVPADRVWLALMHRASRGSLSMSETSPFDPDGDFELRYARLRRYKDSEGSSSAR